MKKSFSGSIQGNCFTESAPGASGHTRSTVKLPDPCDVAAARTTSL